MCVPISAPVAHNESEKFSRRAPSDSRTALGEGRKDKGEWLQLVSCWSGELSFRKEIVHHKNFR